MKRVGGSHHLGAQPQVAGVFWDGAFPPGLHLSDAICRFSVLVEMGVNLSDLLKLTTQYFGYQTKLFGPQGA